MQTATATHPMVPNSTPILPDTTARETSRFVFFAGDHFTPTQKYQSPAFALGGLDADMYLTLSETGKELWARPDLYNTGRIIFRCGITQLKTFRLPVNRNMVAPADVEKYAPGYTQPNGRYRDGQYETVHVGGGNQIYAPFYPGDEIVAITQASNGLRPGGVVEIEALKGKGWQEQSQAQLHYFPNWEAIQREEESLPKTMKELRAHIVERIAVADTADLKAIGRDMVRSCDEFRAWGLRYLKAWRQIVKWADSQIDSPIAGYNEVCEMLFEMLEVNREDTLGQVTNVAEIAGAIGQSIAAAIAQGLSPQQAAAQVSVPAAEAISGDPLAGLVEADKTPGELIDETDDTKTVTDPPADEAFIKVGDKVMVDGKQALVTAKPFGKIKVEFEDQTSKTVEKSEVVVG